MEQADKKSLIGIARFIPSIFSVRVLGRILGFVRQVLIARYFGASALTDAFFAVSQVTTMLKLLFGVGPLQTAATTAIINVEVKEGREKAAKILTTYIFNIAIVASLVLAVLMITSSAWLWRIFPGISDRRELLNLFYILAPTAILGGIMYIGSAGLYARHKFIPLELANIMIPVVAIVFVLAFHVRLSIYSVAFGVLSGSIIAFGFIFYKLYRGGLIAKAKPSFRGYWSKFLITQGSAALLFTLWEQIFRIFERFLASNLAEGMITSLTLAQITVGAAMYLVAQPLSVVSHPILARSYASNDMDDFRKRFADVISGAFFAFALLAAILSATIKPLTFIVFRQGMFSAHAALLTASAGKILAVAVIFQGLYMFLMRVMLAQKNSSALGRIGFYGWSLAMIADVFLAQKLGIVGLAITALAAFALMDVAMISVIARKSRINMIIVLSSFLKSALSSFVTYFFVLTLVRFTVNIFVYGLPSRIMSLLMLFVVGCAGAVFYLVLSALLKQKEVSIVLDELRKIFAKKR